jgi:hypothetical protein
LSQIISFFSDVHSVRFWCIEAILRNVTPAYIGRYLYNGFLCEPATEGRAFVPSSRVGP